MRLRSALFASALALGSVALRTEKASAQCSSQAACPNPCELCRVLPASGTNPSVTEMSSLFDRIAEGPARYGDLGWNFGTRTTISRGNSSCGGTIMRELIPVTFPCVLLKAIYSTESNWRQFCDSSRTVVAFDCGYGIAQVTSGMRRGDTSAFDPDRVASSAAYNVSVGASILRDKWLAAPCVGANDPAVIEHWYFATWGYNGFAVKNNPNNPMYRADRPEFRTPGVASAQTRGNYPYQELVWGYAHYPPSAAHWTGVGLVYPPRSSICASCGSPTSSIAELEGAHRSSCPADPTPVDAGVDAAIDAPVPVDVQPDVQPDVRPDVAAPMDAPRDVPQPDVMEPPPDEPEAMDAAPEAGMPPRYEPTGCGCRTAPGLPLGRGGVAVFAAISLAGLARGVRRRARR